MVFCQNVVNSFFFCSLATRHRFGKKIIYGSNCGTFQSKIWYFFGKPVCSRGTTTCLSFNAFLGFLTVMCRGSYTRGLDILLSATVVFVWTSQLSTSLTSRMLVTEWEEVFSFGLLSARLLHIFMFAVKQALVFFILRLGDGMNFWANKDMILKQVSWRSFKFLKDVVKQTAKRSH